MKLNLLDGSFLRFGQQSASLGGDNAGEKPRSLSWTTDSGDLPITFLTDMKLREVDSVEGYKVAWLLEPPSLSDGHYQTAIELEDKFDAILTFRKDLLQRGEKWEFYPFGGSWITERNWGLHEKSKNCCIIVSQKTGAEGHRLRHSVVSELTHAFDIDVYGRGYDPFDSKMEFLQDYRYAIVIESWLGDYYFSEKLIDALSVGCVPIYRGCPSIGEFFDDRAILRFASLSALQNILINVCSQWDYDNRIPALQANLKACRRYRCSEDWIAENGLLMVKHKYLDWVFRSSLRLVLSCAF